VPNIDTALNICWALLCVGTLLWHFVRQRRDVARGQSCVVRLNRTLSVFLAAVALFPCISASDDRVMLQELDSPIGHAAGFNNNHPNNFALCAQLNAIESVQATTPFVLAVVWRSFLLASISDPTTQHASWRAALNRGPPVL